MEKGDKIKKISKVKPTFLTIEGKVSSLQDSKTDDLEEIVLKVKKAKTPKAPKKEKAPKAEKAPKKPKALKKIDSSIKQSVKVIVGSNESSKPIRKEISKQTTYITLDRPYQLTEEEEDKLSITKFINKTKKEPSTATLNTVVSNQVNEIPKANTQEEVAIKEKKPRKKREKIPISRRMTEEQAGYMSFPPSEEEIETLEEVRRRERLAAQLFQKYQKEEEEEQEEE